MSTGPGGQQKPGVDSQGHSTSGNNNSGDNNSGDNKSQAWRYELAICISCWQPETVRILAAG